ncbi:hypothetical protein FHX74_003201 [Friedmanniella endophytica]|uniref:Uncharacterized protein n=1 Tax=Microlunatus kandeliicorticis TaxID=1759536 RepID=A0A7W3IUW9_9ACTN|nr:hypothetical protein [Microlunatus kandeliicorticis]MBA8795565.1 hypothetical protein [Microlunatus kandeliicorticis]
MSEPVEQWNAWRARLSDAELREAIRVAKSGEYPVPESIARLLTDRGAPGGWVLTQWQSSNPLMATMGAAVDYLRTLPEWDQVDPSPSDA